MKTNGSETGVSEKPRRSKSREVSSRFLSLADAGTNAGSPLRQKPRSSTDGRKNRSEEESGFMQKLWPASMPKPMKSNSKAKNETLADYLGSERLKEDFDRKRNEKLENKSMMFLNRQKSCSEFSRFENTKENSKENHKPLFGGSMRYFVVNFSFEFYHYELLLYCSTQIVHNWYVTVLHLSRSIQKRDATCAGYLVLGEPVFIN